MGIFFFFSFGNCLFHVLSKERERDVKIESTGTKSCGKKSLSNTGTQKKKKKELRFFFFTGKMS